MKQRLTMMAAAMVLLTGVLSPAGAQNARDASMQSEPRTAPARAHRVGMRIERDTLIIRGTVASAAEKRKLERELRTFWPDGTVRSHLAVRVEKER